MKALRDRVERWRRQFDEAVLPLATREMRSFMRGWRAPVALAVCTGLMIVLAGYFLYDFFRDVDNLLGSYEDAARQYYGALYAVEGILMLLLASALVSDSFSGEVRRRTMEALILTRLRPLDIVLGKLLAAIGTLAIALLCLLPVLCIGFLLGGISPPEVVLGQVLLLSAAFCIGATGCFISASVQNSAAAALLTALFAFLWFYHAALIMLITAPVVILRSLLAKQPPARQPLFFITVPPPLYLIYMGIILAFFAILQITDSTWYYELSPMGSFRNLVYNQYTNKVWLISPLVASLILYGGGWVMLYRAADTIRRRWPDQKG